MSARYVPNFVDIGTVNAGAVVSGMLLEAPVAVVTVDSEMM